MQAFVLSAYLLAASVTALGMLYYVLWSAGARRLPFQALVAVLMLMFALAVGRVSGRLAAKAVEARDRRHKRADGRSIEGLPEAEDRRLARVEITYLGALAGAIMLFAMIAAVTTSLADPRVRPVAALFGDGRTPLCGLFVARNADHVYIAIAEKNKDIPNLGNHARGRLLDMPAKDVIALNIGTARPSRSRSGAAETSLTTSCDCTSCGSPAPATDATRGPTLMSELQVPDRAAVLRASLRPPQVHT